jgi:hypothetical protein
MPRSLTDHSAFQHPDHGRPCHFLQMLGEKVSYDVFANDIWGLGCVLFEVSALKPAFSVSLLS